MGGWAKNNSVTEGNKYIDPTVTPSLAAWLVIG
jgi:hypothetical protein